jgi:hypothetical protein
MVHQIILSQALFDFVAIERFGNFISLSYSKSYDPIIEGVNNPSSLLGWDTNLL